MNAALPITLKMNVDLHFFTSCLVWKKIDLLFNIINVIANKNLFLKCFEYFVMNIYLVI